MANQDTFKRIFHHFVRLRQDGRNRNEAWDMLEESIRLLTRPQRDQLIALMRNWESTEGRNYRVSDDPFETLYKAPAGLEEIREEMSSSPLIRRIKPVHGPQGADAQVECPNCHKLNRQGEVYCFSCGTMLVAAGSTRKIGDDTERVAATDTNTAFFGDESVLLLQVEGAPEPLHIQPRKTEMVIGRSSPDSVMIPDIDLAPYRADVLGISRLHAALRRHGDTLVLTDMDSLNHTLLNGKRVHAHEVRVLNDGDVLQFGKLRMRVHFKQAQA